MKAGECWRIECTPAPKVLAYYMTVVGSVWSQLYQLFKTHNSVYIKDLLQQTEKYRDNGNRARALPSKLHSV